MNREDAWDGHDVGEIEIKTYLRRTVREPCVIVMMERDGGAVGKMIDVSGAGFWSKTLQIRGDELEPVRWLLTAAWAAIQDTAHEELLRAIEDAAELAGLSIDRIDPEDKLLDELGKDPEIPGEDNEP